MDLFSWTSWGVSLFLAFTSGFLLGCHGMMRRMLERTEQEADVMAEELEKAVTLQPRQSASAYVFLDPCSICGSPVESGTCTACGHRTGSMS